MLGVFKKDVERAEEAKKKGDTKKMEMHLNNARNRLFGMKTTETAKLKNTDHYDRYKEMKGLDEGIIKPHTGLLQKSFSEIQKRSENTPGEFILIARGDDFEIYAAYRGSLKRQMHVIIKNDKIIGSGWTAPLALKDAGLKPKNVKTFSKFVDGSVLNTIKENK